MAVSFLISDRVIFRRAERTALADPVSPPSSVRVSSAPATGMAGPPSSCLPDEHWREEFNDTIGRGISVFLPAYNERDNLPTVVTQTLRALEAISPHAYHLIIVNDGSHDDTGEVADRLAVEHGPHVTVVHHAQNQGYGHALRSGFATGLLDETDWVGFMDSDGQFDPIQFERLIAAADHTHADLAVGFRIKRADGLLRLLTGRAWHLLTRIVCGIDIHDVDCGFKLVHRNVLNHITLAGSYAAVSPELLVKAKRAGFRTTQVGVDHFPRRAGEQTGANLGVIFRSLLGLVKLRSALSRRVVNAEPSCHPGSARVPRATGVALLASAVSLLSFALFYTRGETLAYDDSISHLLIARRVLEGTTPGLAQLGSVWLPLPHLLMAPFTGSNYLFYTGISGSLISMTAFVVTAVLLFKTGAIMTASRWGGWIAALIFIANPNMLYLQSTPMTETLLFACMTAAVYELLRWSISEDWRHLALCACAVFLATVTRYEGWVLLASIVPAIGYVLVRRRVPLATSESYGVLFLTLGGAGVLGWLLWNRIIFGAFFNFATGKFSKPSLWVSASDPATGHLAVAVRTYLIAVTETVGVPSVAIALVGIPWYLWRTRLGPRAVAPLTLLTLLPFFIVAIYSGQRPLHVRQIFGDLYNTRFGLVMLLPAALFGAFALVSAGRVAARGSRRVTTWLRARAGAASDSPDPQSTPRRLGWLVAASAVVALAALVATSSAGATRLSHGVVTLDEALHWNGARMRVAPAAATLRKDYTGGLVLMQGFGNEYVSFASRIPADQTIYEGSYRLWEPALRDPAAHGIKWIYMSRSKSDQVWQSLHGSPQLKSYLLVFDDGTRMIYRSRSLVVRPATAVIAGRRTNVGMR